MIPPPVPPPPRGKPSAGLVVAGGKVRLDQLLGKGGMGSVWRGTHLTLGTPVAVKFMADSSPEALARFQREAQVAAQIRSTNVVAIHDFGVESSGMPYIVMELLDGEDLAARLKRASRLSLSETAQILLAVARGLDRAHQAKLVHRDLKPENIFLVREGDEDVPKILDFGIAKTLVADPDSFNVTHEGAVLGTPYYMSPEQSRARKDVDHRADLWALGVIVFRMITGRRPFDGVTAASLAVQICTEPTPPISSVAPDLPLQLDVFFNRALAKDPAHRFQTARELAQAFAEIAGYTMQLGRTPLPSWSGASTSPHVLSNSNPLGRTGPSGATPQLSTGTGTGIQAPAPSNRRTIAIVAITTLLVVGGGLFVLFGQKSNTTAQPDPRLAQSTIAAAAPLPQPSATASTAMTAPSTAEPEPIEIVETEPEKAVPVKSTVKTTKPAGSATKKPSRDLGY